MPEKYSAKGLLSETRGQVPCLVQRGMSMRGSRYFCILIALVMFVAFSACSNGIENDRATETSSSTYAPLSTVNVSDERAVGKLQSVGDLSAQASQSSGRSSDQTSGLDGTVSSNGTLKVHYIDVGQADSILVQTPNGKNMLIDAGNNADSSKVVAYLKSHGVNKIDVLVGTHPHEDHIGGMTTVVNSFNIGKVYMPKVSHTTKTYTDLIKAIGNKGLKITEATTGVNIDIDSSLSKLIIIAPNSKTYDNMNDYSAVIRLVYKSTSFLFAGDAAEASEHEMVSNGISLSADVLKIGHHGSSTSTTPAFLKAVAPKYAVISVGKDNDYGHPNPAALSRLNQAKVEIYRTDISGTIIVSSNGSVINFDKSATN